MINKKKLSEEEKLKLYDFFEKELTSEIASVNLLLSCQIVAKYFEPENENIRPQIKHLVRVMEQEKRFISDIDLTIILDEGRNILFAMESCAEIRKIFGQQGICLGLLFQVSPDILKIFYQKYPEYKKPPV